MTDGMDAYAESLRYRSDNEETEAKGSAKCPFCGVDTPHSHSQEELISAVLKERARAHEAVKICNWIAEVGPPHHPDDERHFAMAFCNEKRRAESAESRLAAVEEKAALYEFLRDLKCNNFTLSRDDGHACNYMTAEEYINHPMNENNFSDVDEWELQAMKDTNTIWDFHIYPDTPIGFISFKAATLDAAIAAAIRHLKEKS